MLIRKRVVGLEKKRAMATQCVLGVGVRVMVSSVSSESRMEVTLERCLVLFRRRYCGDVQLNQRQCRRRKMVWIRCVLLGPSEAVLG
jgi:hypothetical protein